MELRILGPVELWDGARRIALGRAKERALLGVLALSSGRPVGTRVLSEALWDDHPPGNARKDLQIYVSRLRRYLRDAGASARIVTRADTYAFYPHDDEVDYVRFKDFLKSGRGAYRESRHDEAAELLYQGLALWQGPPVGELTTMWMEQRREELDGYDRFVGYQVLCDVELERGNHLEVLRLLDEIADGHELDSTYIAHRLSALDGCGHYADFDAYWRVVFRRNVESFGTGPPRELREFHSGLLRARERLVPSTRFAVPDRPAQLPPLVSDFVGRRDELGRLESLLARSQLADPVAPLVIALAGPAGVGKTELALQWAHTIKRQFPDGQLYAELSGYAPAPPVEPAAVIADFLHALGVPPAAIPDTLAASSALLRTILDDKRVLIVLDDARDSSQVRPLLPASAHCVLVVTSRHRLTDLVTRGGAHRLVIQPLATPAAVTLLRRLLSAAELRVDKDEVDALVALAGGMPRAVRTIAELAPLESLPTLSALLTAGEDESHTMHAVLSRSYRSLPAGAAVLFRVLSLHPGPDFGVAAAAVLAGSTEEHARQHLTALARISLIESSGSRFSMHPLVRAFAASLLEPTDPGEHAASQRMLEWYLEAVAVAGVEWINAERLNLVALVELAAGRRRAEAWQLLRSLRRYIEREAPPSDWVGVHTVVLAATRQSGDLEGEGATLIGLGLIHRRTGDTRSELECLEGALKVYRVAHDLRGQSESLILLADRRDRGGDLAAAMRLSTAALASQADIDEPGLRADVHYQLGVLHARLGDVAEAERNLNRAAELYRHVSDRAGQLRTLTQLGLLSRDGQRLGPAIALFREAVTVGTGDGMDPTHVLPALVNLSELCCDDNQHDVGYTYARKAVGLCHPRQDFPHVVRALVVLVRALSAIGNHDEATKEARKVVELVADVPDSASDEALRQLRQLGFVTPGTGTGSYG